VHGGNIDNKELVAGTTLYLLVFAEGALFSCGDGYGAQGNGEVCVTAIETALRGRFRLSVLKDHNLTYPQAETRRIISRWEWLPILIAVLKWRCAI
jgi:acetamidase/formamidase